MEVNGITLASRSPWLFRHLVILYKPWTGSGLVKAVNHSTYTRWPGVIMLGSSSRTPFKGKENMRRIRPTLYPMYDRFSRIISAFKKSFTFNTYTTPCAFVDQSCVKATRKICPILAFASRANMYCITSLHPRQ